MSLLLCHECFTWVEPYHERCPDCQQTLDATAADPPLSRLEKVIGPLLGPIGEVRLERKLLPDQGLLYRTANGLYFLPHKVERETQLVPVCDADTSFLWSLAGLAFAPLAFIAPFMKRKNRIVEREVRIYRPHFLEASQSDLLPQLLMENPGVFFIPRESIRAVERRRHFWRILRTIGPPLRMTPVDRSQFDEQMESIALASGK